MRKLKLVGRERAKLKVEMDREQSTGSKVLLFDRIGDNFEMPEEGRLHQMRKQVLGVDGMKGVMLRSKECHGDVDKQRDSCIYAE